VRVPLSAVYHMETVREILSVTVGSAVKDEAFQLLRRLHCQLRMERKGYVWSFVCARLQPVSQRAV